MNKESRKKRLALNMLGVLIVVVVAVLAALTYSAPSTSSQQQMNLDLPELSALKHVVESKIEFNDPKGEVINLAFEFEIKTADLDSVLSDVLSIYRWGTEKLLTECPTALCKEYGKITVVLVTPFENIPSPSGGKVSNWAEILRIWLRPTEVAELISIEFNTLDDLVGVLQQAKRAEVHLTELVIFPGFEPKLKSRP